MASRDATPQPLLARNDGVGHLFAVEAIVKGMLESDVAVATVAAVRREPFAGLFRQTRDPAVAETFSQHGMTIVEVGSAARAVDLAVESAADATGRGAGGVALIPNAHLTEAIDALRRATRDRATGADSTALPTRAAPYPPLVCVLEDDPSVAALCPRSVCRLLDIACIEPVGVGQARDVTDVALRMSSATGRPVAVIVHRSIARSSDTIALRPNRAAHAVDALLAQRAAPTGTGAHRAASRIGRTPSTAALRGIARKSANDDATLLRMARRIELNRLQRLPSPGEREPVGFVLVGPCTVAMTHILHVLRMTGRVPILELVMLHPIDEPAVVRLLSRCEHVIVLEPRSGVIEPAILDIAESMRRGPSISGASWLHPATDVASTDAASGSSGRPRPSPSASASARQPALIWTADLPTVAGDAPRAPTDGQPDSAPDEQSTEPASKRLPASPDDRVHPSLLARRVVQVLHKVRPSIDITRHLVAEPDVEMPAPTDRHQTIGIAGAMLHIERIVRDLAEWIDAAREETAADAIPPAAVPPMRIMLDGEPISPTIVQDGTSPVVDAASSRPSAGGVSEPPGTGSAQRPVHGTSIERFTQHRFLREGIAAVRQAARSSRPRIFVVCAVGDDDDVDLERLVRGAVPADRAPRVQVETVPLSQRALLREKLRAAILKPVTGDRDESAGRSMTGGVTVIIASDPPPSHFDVRRIEQGLAEVDRLGFEPRQRMIWSIDRTCAIRLAADAQLLERAQDRDPELMHPKFNIDRLPSKARQRAGRFHMHLRPLFEQVEVVRTRPPLASWRKELATRLTPPQPLHARQPVWRAHLAGFRGESPGVVASVLCDAGRQMGYHVRSVCATAPIGPGRRAWAQLLFTRPRNDGADIPLTAVTPFGEADVLIGLDWAQTLRAVGVDRHLRVADRSRTCALANIGFFADERQSEAAQAERRQQRALIEATTITDQTRIEDLAEACRTSFHTDRVTDVVALGFAFQSGWIPLTLEAIEAALQRQESRGYGRCVEAFEFGRRLAVNRKLLSRPRIETAGAAEDIERLCRRLTLGMQRSGWGGRRRATRFGHLLQRTLLLTPGLAETDAGRAARRDLVHALYRATLWGGIDYAGQLADRVVRLYEADRGETGRAVTRAMVLPLADANLIRDAVYIAALTRSPEQQRRVRQYLMIKLARGDVIERRFLTRFELIAFGRHIRADIRTSDWPARTVAMLQRIVPIAWRGTQHDRRIRRHINDLTDQMARNISHDYQRWFDVARDLHQRAIEDRLRSVDLGETP